MLHANSVCTYHYHTLLHQGPLGPVGVFGLQGERGEQVLMHVNAIGAAICLCAVYDRELEVLMESLGQPARQ